MLRRAYILRPTYVYGEIRDWKGSSYDYPLFHLQVTGTSMTCCSLTDAGRTSQSGYSPRARLSVPP